VGSTKDIDNSWIFGTSVSSENRSMCLGAGQTKAGKQYDKFRHFGLDKVKMEFAIFAIAFNNEKLYNKSLISRSLKSPQFINVQ